MIKSELRQTYIARRNELTPADAADLSRRIADRFFSNIKLDAVRVLSVFIRIARFNEIDTSAIYYRIWRDAPRIRTVAPSTDLATGAIESVEFNASTELAESKWGIREPVGTCIDPHEIDLVLVPLLCFDRRGHRVGYGKGYYDKFLTEVRPDCQKIGLSYFDPVDEIEGTGAHDVALDGCITPAAFFRF